MKQAKININNGQVSEFCRKWGIVELSLFGSILRDDFGPESDVDVLVRFSPESRLGLMDLARMEAEDPDVAAALHKLIIRMLSERVSHLMGTVEALQH